MVRPTISCALMGFAMFTDVAQGINIYVTNKCDESMVLAHVTPNGVTTDDLACGGTITKSIEPSSGSHVFKSGTGAEATLAEFSTVGGKSWYDISAIPTGKKSGPGYCTSLQDCKTVTGGVGFNVPIQITPRTPDGGRCVELTCLTENCIDAYQFPKDDTKTHTCPLSTDFDLTFCAGGSGGQAPMASPAPTPPSTPSTMPNPPSTSSPEPASPSPEPASPSPAPASPSPAPASPSPASASPSSAPASPSLEPASPSPDAASPSPDPASLSLKKSSSSPEPASPSLKKSSSSSQKSPSSTTDSDKNPTYAEHQSIDQFEQSPVSDLKNQANYENLRKENGKTEPSVNTQQTTETNQKPQKTDDATGGTNSAVSLNKDDHVQQINTRSADKSGGATFIFVGVVALCVVMVAAATIVGVRKKKAQLEELESKTPQSTTAHGTLANFRTPRNNVSVL
ncbi:hypothetical protein KXD40_009173 [Peronospora effusa]|uniref:Thaumatin-like protein n=1 Tax=Peronospora effusa TaxID=542832 RepID=A0A3R7XQC8_9STRA|nr:hypothetical protein DD237_006906 [Peronospora effusa]UIZ25381.1 hypothetical protein KXD40_009173 [Peronospora effusa]CAI5707069.1 unnamed protein product [Peronospora effusa]